MYKGVVSIMGMHKGMHKGGPSLVRGHHQGACNRGGGGRGGFNGIHVRASSGCTKGDAIMTSASDLVKTKVQSRCVSTVGIWVSVLGQLSFLGGFAWLAIFAQADCRENPQVVRGELCQWAER